MARSVSGAAVGALGALVLSGCATTMDEAARLQLNNARIRATETPLQITGADPGVTVSNVTLVSARGSTAVVVTLRNRSRRPRSDLSLLVGAATRGRRVYLNRDAGLDYFASHVPAIAAGGELRWVLTVPRRLPAGAQPFAELGAPAAGLAAAIGALPAVRATAQPSGVLVENHSTVPQLQLPVYAVAERAGRLVAAGQAEIAHLGSGARRELRVPLIGNPTGATVSVAAPTTIFR